jgi:hypothetical protein
MKRNYLLIVLLVCSCNQKVAKPMGEKQGFSILKISEDTFEVTVQGGYNVSGQLIRKYFLCKSAEVTLQNGGSYFIILRDERDKSKGIDILDPDATPRSVILGQLSEVKYSNFLAREEVQTYKGAIRYSNIGTIKLLKEIPQEGEYYDAKLISEKITPKIRESLHNESHRSAFRTIFKVMDVFKETL